MRTLLKTRTRLRFSLRSMFVVMTFLAVDAWIVRCGLWPSEDDFKRGIAWPFLLMMGYTIVFLNILATMTFLQIVENIRSFVNEFRNSD